MASVLVDVPVDRGEDVKRFRGIARHGEDGVGGLRDDRGRLARGVEHVQGDHRAGNVTALKRSGVAAISPPASWMFSMANGAPV